MLVSLFLPVSHPSPQPSSEVFPRVARNAPRALRGYRRHVHVANGS